MALVDELVVKLGLDNKDFQKNSKAATNQLNSVKTAGASAARGIEDSSRRMGLSMIKLASLIAAGTAAFKLFTSYVAEGANLSRLARNLGTSADSLHRWGKAVQQAGGTAQGFQATMRSISAALTEQQTTGTSGIAGWLSVLGVSLVDAEGKAKKVETLLLDIGEGVQRKTANRADQFNILQSMGIDEGTANLILKSRVEAEKLIAQQSGFSNDAAKKAESTEAKWLAIQERINGKFRELAEKLLPTIERLVDSLSKSFETMAPMISGIADAFVKINEATDGWLTTLLLAVGALKLARGLLPGIGAAGAASGAAGAGLLGAAGASVGAAVAVKGDTGPDYQGASELAAKARAGDREAATKLARIQLDNQLWRKIFGNKASESEVQQRALDILGPNAKSMSGKVSYGGDMQSKLSAAEAANGLPPGILSSIIKQETGGNQAYINDPSKYHYGLNAEGKRIAGHTGKVSTAFGPFGLLESTSANPGYGVKPLADKSMDEQIRFAAEYLAARGKSAGGLFAGLSGYGEGPKYATQVLGRLGGPMSGVSTAGAGRGSQGATQVSIGEINIQTAATDARGIASAIRQELVMQANTGMR